MDVIENENNIQEETAEAPQEAVQEEQPDQNQISWNELEEKVVRVLKENANFQIQVRQNMQRELEDARKMLKGDIFVPLLKEIAELYVEWQDVLDDLEEGVAKRKVKGIFESLRDILEEYGCEFGVSEVGSKRRTRLSRIKNTVSTPEKERHETVAKSHNPWIYREPFLIYPEYVDVYVFNAESGLQENEKDEEAQEASE